MVVKACSEPVDNTENVIGLRGRCKHPGCDGFTTLQRYTSGTVLVCDTCPNVFPEKPSLPVDNSVSKPPDHVVIPCFTNNCDGYIFTNQSKGASQGIMKCDTCGSTCLPNGTSIVANEFYDSPTTDSNEDGTPWPKDFMQEQVRELISENYELTVRVRDHSRGMIEQSKKHKDLQIKVTNLESTNRQLYTGFLELSSLVTSLVERINKLSETVECLTAIKLDSLEPSNEKQESAW